MWLSKNKDRVVTMLTKVLKDGMVKVLKDCLGTDQDSQGRRDDDVDQGSGGGERRRHGRPVLPRQQSRQRALHLIEA